MMANPLIVRMEINLYGSGANLARVLRSKGFVVSAQRQAHSKKAILLRAWRS